MAQLHIKINIIYKKVIKILKELKYTAASKYII